MRGSYGGVQLYLLSALLSTLVFFPQLISAQQPATRPRQVAGLPSSVDPPTLVGQIETSLGEYRLNLVNHDQRRTVSGFIVIQMGTVTKQSEAIRLRFSLAPLEGMLFPLRPLAATGDYFTITVSDRQGAIIYERIAPVRRTESANWPVTPPTETIGNRPVAQPENPAVSVRNEKLPSTSPTVTSASSPVVTIPSTAPPATPAAADSGIRVKTRLAGGENDNDPFVLAFEVTVPRPLNKVTLNLSGKGINQKRIVNLNNTTLVEFKLPDELPEQKLRWKLTDSDSKLLAQGDADLTMLLEDDYVSVSRAASDRESYAPGEMARITLDLSGSTPGGVRIEVIARDTLGTIIFRDARKAVTTGGRGSQSFTITLPRDSAGAVIFEYKVLDAESGRLFDSGDTEIRVVEKSSGQ